MVSSLACENPYKPAHVPCCKPPQSLNYILWFLVQQDVSSSTPVISHFSKDLRFFLSFFFPSETRSWFQAWVSFTPEWYLGIRSGYQVRSLLLKFCFKAFSVDRHRSSSELEIAPMYFNSFVHSYNILKTLGIIIPIPLPTADLLSKFKVSLQCFFLITQSKYTVETLCLSVLN